MSSDRPSPVRRGGDPLEEYRARRAARADDDDDVTNALERRRRGPMFRPRGDAGADDDDVVDLVDDDDDATNALERMRRGPVVRAPLVRAPVVRADMIPNPYRHPRTGLPPRGHEFVTTASLNGKRVRVNDDVSDPAFSGHIVREPDPEYMHQIELEQRMRDLGQRTPVDLSMSYFPDGTNLPRMRLGVSRQTVDPLVADPAHLIGTSTVGLDSLETSFRKQLLNDRVFDGNGIFNVNAFRDVLRTADPDNPIYRIFDVIRSPAGVGAPHCTLTDTDNQSKQDVLVIPLKDVYNLKTTIFFYILYRIYQWCRQEHRTRHFYLWAYIHDFVNWKKLGEHGALEGEFVYRNIRLNEILDVYNILINRIRNFIPDMTNADFEVTWTPAHTYSDESGDRLII